MSGGDPPVLLKPDLARVRWDGGIDRSGTRDTPRNPVAQKAAFLCGTLAAETILASGPLRPHQQAGHMDASEPIHSSRQSCKQGAVHIWIASSLRSPQRGLKHEA